VISVSTFAFALALGAVASAVAALIISLRHTQAQALWRSRMANEFAKLSRSIDASATAVNKKLHELESRSPTKLAAEVAELSDAVERLAATQARFAGRWHKERQIAGSNGHDEHAAADPEVQAMLALQSAAPVK